jgi:hypothetical protein
MMNKKQYIAALETGDVQPWLYNGVEFNQDTWDNEHSEFQSFVYNITNIENGRQYIGKKLFYGIRSLPPLAGKKRKRKVKKTSDWERYFSSSKLIEADIKVFGHNAFKREILSIHVNKTEANYCELQEQIFRDVLQSIQDDDSRAFYNENIDRIYYHNEKYATERLAQYHKMIDNLR